MAIKDPLIRHAISPPTFDERHSIHRERLVDAIHANMPRKLIAIAAPAGYGKTTLLADFGANTELTVCWLRLSEAEWDVMRFAEVLGATLQSRFRRLKGQTDLEAHANSSPEALAVAFAAAINEHIAQTFVLAIDEVHLINQSKPVLQFLDRFLEELPEQATVVAAGREVLEVSLARLMAERELAGFGPHDLALTREELVELTEKQQGEPLSDVEIDRLLEESRGWVTGIVMSGAVADLGAGSLIGGGRPMVYEYLASVVLNRQPDKLRRFALDASVLPVMTSEACNAVLEREDSQKYLGRLVRGGLFVTASEGSPRTYEFHPLFRAFLLESMEGADARGLSKLRRKAAKYLLEQGSTEQAIELLFEAGADAKAAQLAESHAKEMFESGRIQTLERWAERLQDDHSKIPSLLLYLAGDAINRGELEETSKLLDRAREFIGPKSSKEVQAIAEVYAAFLALRQGGFQQAIEAADRVGSIYKKRQNPRNQAMALRAKAAALLHSGGDIVLAEQLASQSADLLKGTGEEYQLVAALVDLYMIQSAQGLFQEAARTVDQVLAQARILGAPLPLAVALGNKAMGEHASGEFESALQYGREALKYSRQSASPLREAIALLRQADVFSDIGLTLQAAELYRQSLDILLEVDDVHWIRYGCVQASVLHRRHGGAGVAHEWLKRAIVVGSSKKVPSSVRIQKSALELEAAPEQAIKNLRTLVRKGKQNLEPEELTQVYFFLARAAFEINNEGRCIQTFVEALTHAGRFGTEQIIAAELRFDENFASFVFDHLKSDPTLVLIRSRIETLVALERRYESRTDEEAAELSLAFEALGNSRVIVSGTQVDELKPLATEILYYLLDHHRVSRDQLMETFWPDYTPGRQVSSLHTAIYSIRRELGKEGIQFDGTVYRVDPELSVEYDVARFEQAAAVAEGLPPGDPRAMFALTEAVNLYGGQFLPEFDSEWVDERRRALELRYLDLLASFSEEALVRGQASEAIGWLREALTLDPLRDDTNRFYLEAIGTLGRRSEIVTHYQEYVRALGEELGLDPPEDVRELYDRLIS